MMETRESDTCYSREALYKLVWETPLRKLAPTLGLSDVGLAKICKKHQIPTPPVGHWTRVAHGIRNEPTPLPDLDEADLAEIHFFRKQFFGSNDRPADSIGSAPRITVEVGERLSQPHSCVRVAKESLEKSKPGSVGLVQTEGKCLSVAVSKAMIPRALRILDAAAKAWEQQGGWVKGKSFGLAHNSVAISLFEQTQRLVDEAESRSYWKQYRNEKTGKLTLAIDGRWVSGMRKTWSDGKVQRLEDVLGSFIETLLRWMAVLEEQRVADECRERQRAAAAQRRQRVREKQEAEKKRREHLHAVVEQWKQAEGVRSFLRIAESQEEETKPGRINPSREWLDWVRWYADYLCPLTETPPRDEFVEEPKNKSLADLDLTKETAALLRDSAYQDTDALFVATRQETERDFGRHAYSVREELRDVLEALGYDAADLWGYRY